MVEPHDPGSRTRPPANVAAGPDVRVWCSPATVAAIDAAAGQQRTDLLRAAMSSTRVRHQAAMNAWRYRVGITPKVALRMVPTREPFMSERLSEVDERLEADALSAAQEA